MTAKTEAATQIDETLRESGMGTLIADNKNLFLILIAIILVGVLAAGFYSVQRDSAKAGLSSQVYEFQKVNLIKLTEKKMSVTDYLTGFNTLYTNVDGFEGIAPLLIASADEMIKLGNLNEAKTLLEKGTELGNDFVQYFISLRLAVVYEDLGSVDDAIKTLEGLSLSLMESKTQLDLGRLYRAKGDKTKAKEYFEKVSSNITQAEFSKLAKLYLSEL